MADPTAAQTFASFGVAGWSLLITTAIGSLTAMVVSIINAWRQPTRTDTKQIVDATEKQSAKLETIDSKADTATKAAQEAADNTNSHLTEQNLKLESVTAQLALAQATIAAQTKLLDQTLKQLADSHPPGGVVLSLPSAPAAPPPREPGVSRTTDAKP